MRLGPGTWKLSTDPEFTAKVRDVAGLCMSPPENALVLCADEKSRIQALDRTAPCLPILPATPARMTHDYVRHGTTSLFAALDLASGPVTEYCWDRDSWYVGAFRAQGAGADAVSWFDGQVHLRVYVRDDDNKVTEQCWDGSTWYAGAYTG